MTDSEQKTLDSLKATWLKATPDQRRYFLDGETWRIRNMDGKIGFGPVAEAFHVFCGLKSLLEKVSA